MKLGEFIKKYSHNNLVRLLHKHEGGHKIILNTWDDVSMDWEINEGKGLNRHYVNNEVFGIVGILDSSKKYPDAINIVIEEIKNQSFIDEFIVNKYSNLEEVK